MELKKPSSGPHRHQVLQKIGSFASMSHWLGVGWCWGADNTDCFLIGTIGTAMQAALMLRWCLAVQQLPVRLLCQFTACTFPRQLMPFGTPPRAAWLVAQSPARSHGTQPPDPFSASQHACLERAAVPCNITSAPCFHHVSSTCRPMAGQKSCSDTLSRRVYSLHIIDEKSHCSLPVTQLIGTWWMWVPLKNIGVFQSLPPNCDSYGRSSTWLQHG